MTIAAHVLINLPASYTWIDILRYSCATSLFFSELIVLYVIERKKKTNL